jgi:hypothetical protein
LPGNPEAPGDLSFVPVMKEVLAAYPENSSLHSQMLDNFKMAEEIAAGKEPHRSIRDYGE